jgi:hypothetical protein
MSPEELASLKETYTGQKVTVEIVRPELARWTDKVGKVVTVNCNGRALVQFEGSDQAWYDFNPDFLQLEEPPTESASESDKE